MASIPETLYTKSGVDAAIARALVGFTPTTGGGGTVADGAIDNGDGTVTVSQAGGITDNADGTGVLTTTTTGTGGTGSTGGTGGTGSFIDNGDGTGASGGGTGSNVGLIDNGDGTFSLSSDSTVSTPPSGGGGTSGAPSFAHIIDVPAPTGTATTDQANIATAITSVVNGTLLRFQPGNYAVTVRINIIGISDLVVEGQGATITSTQAGGGSARILNFDSCQRVNVRNLQIVANSPAGGTLDCLSFDHCADVTVTGCFTTRASGATGRGTGIRFWGCVRSTAVGNTIYRTGSDGLTLYQHTRNTATDSAMSSGSAVVTTGSMGWSGLDIGATVTVSGAGAGGADLTAKVVSVSGSTATLSATAATTVSGKTTYLAHEGREVAFVGNRIDGAGDDAISVIAYVSAGTPNHHGITASGNVVTSGAARGITYQGVSGGTITGNTVDSCAGSGILVCRDNGSGTQGVRDVTVIGNRVNNANTNSAIGDYPSIWVYSIAATDPVDGVTIADNVVRGGAVNYIKAGNTGGNVGTSNVTIRGNTCLGGNSNGTSGIRCQFVSNVVVTDNLVVLAHGAGIYVSSDCTGLVRVTDNDVLSPNGSLGSNAGVQITGVTAGTVRFGDNTIVVATGDTTTKGYDLTGSTNVLAYGTRSTAASNTAAASTVTFTTTA